MATFGGNFLGSAIYTAEPSNPAIGNNAPPDLSDIMWEPTLQSASTKTDTQPVDEIRLTLSGNRLDLFGFLDWYERIHVYPLALDLGAIIGAQIKTITTWNAFFTPHTLGSVDETNTDGLTLAAPDDLPLTYAPLEEKEFTITVDTDGPPVVDASYVFAFDSISYTVTVVGIRVVAWQWEANWVTPVIERFEWNTDVMEAYDGSEQRRQLRGYPREQWEFTFDASDDQRRLLENVLYSWGGRIWALPIFTDGEMLTQTLPAGSTSIPLSKTQGRDYHVGGIGLLIGEGTYESFEVTEVNSDSVDIQTPLANSWPAGTRVYPARQARLLEPRSTARFHRNYARGVARFRTVEEIERDELNETLYRNQPVMEREPNWREAPDIDYARKMVSLDLGYGPEHVVDEAGIALPVHSFRWTMLDREEVEYFRSWLYARRGRCRGIWLPTWSDDLILLSPISATDVGINVQACGLTYFAQADVHRRDIRIELHDGTIFYRRVSDFEVVDENTERMAINTVLDEVVQPSDVKRISWMHYVRLDTDTIELTWLSPEMAEVTLVFKGPRNEF